MSDLPDIIDKLPLTKKATPAQMLALILFVALIFGGGAWAAIEGKDYFDKAHASLIAEIDGRALVISGTINTQGLKLVTVEQQAAANARSLDWLKRSSWSNADMNRWAEQLDRMNRASVPALIVPEVPAIPPSIPSPVQ